jgi:hypothetical protein
MFTQLPHSKKYSHLPYYSTYVKGFFFLKTLFLFCSHCHSCRKLKEHGHRPPLLPMFKEEQGVVATWRSKQHKMQHFKKTQKKVCLLHFFLHLNFFKIFIFALHVFKVHQHLDSALMSSTFRRLKLVTSIVVKPTVVGMTVVKMMLLARTLLEWALLDQLCWTASTFFFQVFLRLNFFFVVV